MLLEAWGAGTDTEKADWVINQMDAMVKHLDIPTSLKPYGVTEADLPALVKAGMDVQRLLVNNPAPSQRRMRRHSTARFCKGSVQ